VGLTEFAISGPLLLAAGLAVLAGAVSFASPCVVPLVPGYLAYLTGLVGVDGNEGAGPSRGRVLSAVALFVLGFSVVFVAYGAALGGLGHLLTGHTRLLTRILGGLTILLGLLFAGVFDRFSFAGRIVRPSARPKAGLAGAPLLGVMFGLGWTPCIGPTLTAVLALSASTGTVARGAIQCRPRNVGSLCIVTVQVEPSRTKTSAEEKTADRGSWGREARKPFAK